MAPALDLEEDEEAVGDGDILEEGSRLLVESVDAGGAVEVALGIFETVEGERGVDSGRSERTYDT